MTDIRCYIAKCRFYKYGFCTKGEITINNDGKCNNLRIDETTEWYDNTSFDAMRMDFDIWRNMI